MAVDAGEWSGVQDGLYLAHHCVQLREGELDGPCNSFQVKLGSFNRGFPESSKMWRPLWDAGPGNPLGEQVVGDGRLVISEEFIQLL